MKVFLDTNIFIEYIEERKQVEAVDRILKAIADGEHDGVISQGAFYTLAFLLEKALKRKGIQKPLQTEQLRGLLSDVLSTAVVVGVSHEHLEDAVGDKSFTDFEDSFQYQCALENNCDALVTINMKDYRKADQTKLTILTPTSFVEKYL